MGLWARVVAEVYVPARSCHLMCLASTSIQGSPGSIQSFDVSGRHRTLRTRGRVRCVVLLAMTAGLAGCETKAGTGAIVGGLGGAAVGGLIGSKSHARAGEGALIGGAVGALGGALVGHGMDK